jgi:hypothetical protein
MPWRLEIVHYPDALLHRGLLTLLGRAVEVPLGRAIIVGRSPDCDLVLPSIAVARRHTELRRDEQGVCIRDLNSPCGTYAKVGPEGGFGQIRGPTRLEVDEFFFPGPPAVVLMPRFAVPSAWLEFDDGAIWRLAQAAQMGRDWSVLPVLADALEEAGCDEEDLLRHFREVDHKHRHCTALMRLLEGLWAHRKTRGRA